MSICWIMRPSGSCSTCCQAPSDVGLLFYIHNIFVYKRSRNLIGYSPRLQYLMYQLASPRESVAPFFVAVMVDLPRLRGAKRKDKGCPPTNEKA